MKGLEVEKTEGTVLHFKKGTYDSATGVAKYSKMELPFVLDKMVSLHKSQSKDAILLKCIFRSSTFLLCYFKFLDV
jgi:hypothetical protein